MKTKYIKEVPVEIMKHKVTNKELIYKHKSIGHKTSKITELNMKH